MMQVYKPYLLMNKKRYAGLLWTNPEKFDNMDTKVTPSPSCKGCHGIPPQSMQAHGPQFPLDCDHLSL